MSGSGAGRKDSGHEEGIGDCGTVNRIYDHLMGIYARQSVMIDMILNLQDDICALKRAEIEKAAKEG